MLLRSIVRRSLSHVSTKSKDIPVSSQQAEPRTEEEDEGNVDRHPWEVEDRDQSLAGQERTHGVHIADRLLCIGGRHAAKWQGQ